MKSGEVGSFLGEDEGGGEFESFAAGDGGRGAFTAGGGGEVGSAFGKGAKIGEVPAVARFSRRRRRDLEGSIRHAGKDWDLAGGLSMGRTMARGEEGGEEGDQGGEEEEGGALEGREFHGWYCLLRSCQSSRRSFRFCSRSSSQRLAPASELSL